VGCTASRNISSKLLTLPKLQLLQLALFFRFYIYIYIYIYIYMYVYSWFLRWLLGVLDGNSRIFRSSARDIITTVTGLLVLLALSLLQLVLVHLFLARECNLFLNVISVYILFTVPISSFSGKTLQKTRYFRHLDRESSLYLTENTVHHHRKDK